ncbi:FUSC family protein [Variovorax sp. Sphag1AA]|uniref:FUSC family protein n=1 Tax=Variovorax sp. Sphag1AA TaxID=2587027 RepID=UPI00160F73E4|nr:FUSC family protein [Variovorax sp. Sphag1AA]MBB3177644.1 putative membrane protein YccC [Variovorax sp. Sphag1AA]
MPTVRAIQAMRPVLSVALAVGAAHALGLTDTWWAAISAFVVMQEDFGASLYRGALRILGTLAGAGLGIALGSLVAANAAAFVFTMGLAAWAGLFAALRFRHGYAWVLSLVTFVMVLCEAFSLRVQLVPFAMERVSNIVVGTVACVIVAGLTEPRFIAAWFGRAAAGVDLASPPPASPADRRAVALHALDGAMAVALLAIVVVMHDLRSFPQAMVTAIAVLIVPIGVDANDVHGSVMQRMVQRFAGCFVAGAVAFALLPLVQEKPVWCQIALALGVWTGAYLQRGAPRLRYAALQFSVAFLMMFVQDRGWTVEPEPALVRLGGVFAGIAALALVLLVSGTVRAFLSRQS